MGVKIKSKKHWFAFAFTGKQEACGTPCDASLYIGYPDKKITLGRIQACKTDAGVTQEAAMISCSYLGYMTREEFTDGT